MGALSGIRVIDVSQVLAGPYATMLLGDLGADVIKVEAPEHGDHSRQMAPRITDELSGTFLAVNRNKRGISINLKTREGQEILHELARGADVFVENFRPGVSKRLGIDFDTLSKVNERLIYCSISGFGQTGPYASRGGFDLIAQGMSGMMSITGYPGDSPVKAGVPVTDIGAALFATYGILAGLAGRERTGRGQHIDASLFEAGLSFEVWESLVYLHSGKTPGPTGSAHKLAAPYQAIRCADGYINVGADGVRHWPLFCELIGRPELTNDERFVTNTDRVSNLPELIPEIEQVTRTQPRQYWLDKLESVGIPAGPINSVPEALNDPQTAARDMVIGMTDERVDNFRTIGHPVKFSGTPATVSRNAPDIGQHSDEVLSEMGFSAKEIERWRQTGVVA